MTHRTRHVRAGTTIIRVAAAALLLAGCGDRLLESREAELELADPLQGARVADPRMHLRWPEGTPLAINKVLRAPMVVGDAVDHAQAPIPVMSLVRVEVALYRPIDCDKPPAWLLDSRAFDYPASVDEARLADLGLPVHAAEVWLVPASTGGAYSRGCLRSLRSRLGAEQVPPGPGRHTIHCSRRRGVPGTHQAARRTLRGPHRHDLPAGVQGVAVCCQRSG